MKVYILKRELPWAKAGSEWEVEAQSRSIDGEYLMRPIKETMHLSFPYSTFDDWFEEKKPEVEFSREQKESIMDKLDEEYPPHIGKFKVWLLEHTAKMEEEV